MAVKECDPETNSMWISTSHDASARRRAQCRRVKIVEPQPIGRQLVDVRRVNQSTEATELPEACIVEQKDDYVG